MIGYFFLVNKPIECWFSLVCVILSFNLFIRSYFFGLDSSLYIASFLLFTGVSSYFQNFFMIPFYLFYPWYVLSFAYASFMVFSIFQQKIHLKLFALIGVEVIILFIFKLGFLPNTFFYAINITYISFLLYLFCRAFKKNSRSG